MKKLLALLLALMMVFSFAACGEKETADNKTDAGDKSSFTFGTVENNVYENEFIGIGCELPSAWTFYSEEDIMELNNITMSYMDEDFQEAIENATLLYDMYAQSSNGLNNINVVLQKIPQIQLDTLDLEDTFELGFNQAKTALENMGYTNVSFKGEKRKVCGKEMPIGVITSQIGGMPLTQLQFAIKCDGYLASVTISDYTSDGSDLLGLFYSLD